MSEKSTLNGDNDPIASANVPALVEPEPEPQKYKPFKVFVNHVDSFHSKYFSAFIADQVYGALRLAPKGIDEEAANEEAVQLPPEKSPSDKYEVIGTKGLIFKKSTEDIKFTIDDDNDEAFAEEILKCGVIVYDISENAGEIPKALKTLAILTRQLEDAKTIGPKTYDSFEETKTFILVSTVMTWALTKPLDRNDPDLPFSEVDYKKRRPHPNYKQHYNCEKEVIKIGQKYKNKLKTYVVCSGFTYGEEENELDFFFKLAWQNKEVPIFGTGTNRLPFIHIKDLAKALHGLVENAPPKPQYILAVEETPTTYKQFAKSLSKAMSDGKVLTVPQEEAFLYENMTQTLYERITVNINMEPVFLVENLQLEWQTEANIAENMNQVVAQFKNTKNLKPVKIIMHGPPASGKTGLAKKLCEYYNCKYVRIETMLDDFLQIWKESLSTSATRKPEESEFLGEEELEGEMEEEEDLQAIQDQIREMEMLREGGVSKIPPSYISSLMKQYLARNFCQNRGYVLDDYPQLTEQAKELFGHAENVGGEEEEASPIIDTDTILPDLVVSLLATDDFITQRIMKLAEKLIENTPYAEENILERLETYRALNTEDNTVLNYFDELEIDILLIEASEDNNEEFNYVVDKLGPAVTFGLSLEEEEKLYRLEEEQKRLASEKVELDEQLQMQKAEEERKNKMETWAETLERLKAEEEKTLVAQTEPLRNYLMKYVFPVLTKGLIELAALKPEDPVDFLAEYLFKENPEGKIFDPSYNAECEDLYGHFRHYIGKIIDDNEAFE